jgi:hypothetical protein
MALLRLLQSTHYLESGALDPHASMEGFLVFESGFTPLTRDRKIQRMFEFISFIHVRWILLGYLGSR